MKSFLRENYVYTNNLGRQNCFDLGSSCIFNYDHCVVLCIWYGSGNFIIHYRCVDLANQYEDHSLFLISGFKVVLILGFVIT